MTGAAGSGDSRLEFFGIAIFFSSSSAAPVYRERLHWQPMTNAADHGLLGTTPVDQTDSEARVVHIIGRRVT